MKTETHTIKIYKFEELPENVQSKVIDKLWEINGKVIERGQEGGGV